MASNINSNAIDEAYPVAGQDNDTQGFRDNFNYIKVGLTTAASEITNLQSVTQGLSLTKIEDNEGTNLGSDFGGLYVSNALMKDNTKSLVSGGTTTATELNINYGNGNYQVYSIDRAVEVNFVDGFTSTAQTNGMADMYVELRGTEGGPFGVTFFTNGTYAIAYGTDYPTTVQVDNGQSAIFHVIHRHRSVEPGFLEKTVFIKLVGIFE